MKLCVLSAQESVPLCPCVLPASSLKLIPRSHFPETIQGNIFPAAGDLWDPGSKEKDLKVSCKPSPSRVEMLLEVSLTVVA